MPSRAATLVVTCRRSSSAHRRRATATPAATVRSGARSGTASSSGAMRSSTRTIGAILGDDGVLVVDTRARRRQADEILADLRELHAAARLRSSSTPTATHDHAFGNQRVPAGADLGPRPSVRMVVRRGRAQLAAVSAAIPELAGELGRGRTRSAGPVVRRGCRDDGPVRRRRRPIDLRYLGRGHTDNDIVVLCPTRTCSRRRLLSRGRRHALLRRRLPARLAGTAEGLVGLVTGAARVHRLAVAEQPRLHFEVRLSGRRLAAR